MITLHGGKNLVAVGMALQDELSEEVPLICHELGTPVRPWAIGAGKQLLALAKDGRRTRVRRLIADYTRRSSYLRAMSEETSMRHSLDGGPVEPVSQEHRENAKERLAKRLRWKEQRRMSAAKQKKRARPPVPAPDDVQQEAR